MKNWQKNFDLFNKFMKWDRFDVEVAAATIQIWILISLLLFPWNFVVVLRECVAPLTWRDFLLVGCWDVNNNDDSRIDDLMTEELKSGTRDPGDERVRGQKKEMMIRCLLLVDGMMDSLLFSGAEWRNWFIIIIICVLQVELEAFGNRIISSDYKYNFFPCQSSNNHQSTCTIVFLPIAWSQF